MLNIIKSSIGLTNKYIILATPLILFSLISCLYLLFSSNGNQLNLFFAIILFFLMLGAFLSGWLYMIKKCVSNPQYDDINTLLMEFPSGVGEYFLPMCGVIIIVGIFSIAMAIGSYLIGIHLIGDIKTTYQGIINASASASALKNYLQGLPIQELMKLNLWTFLLFFITGVSHFLLMFYTPALLFKNKNPIISFFVSIKDLFCRHFFKNILLFLIIFGIYIIFSILLTTFGTNIFIHFIMTLANFYFIVFAAICIFNYYYKHYIQIGANIDTKV